MEKVTSQTCALARPLLFPAAPGDSTSQGSPFCLSAQAQQWGPAARGPAPQGEVPRGLCDSCQRLLNLPWPSPAAR